MVKEWVHWCRLCAKEDLNNTHVNILLEDQKEIPLSDTINKCFSIDITPLNGKPNMICEECQSFIVSIINFAKKTSQVQAMFAELLDISESLDSYKTKEQETKFDHEAILPTDPYNNLSKTNTEVQDPLIELTEIQKTEQDKLNIDIKIEEPLSCTYELDQTYEPEPESYDHLSTNDCSKSKLTKKKERKIGKKKIKKERHTCLKCQKVFKLKLQLVRHMEKEHANKEDPLFICEVCGKICKTKGNLKDHKLSHSQERKHKCKFCDKTFIRVYTLKRHEDSHNETKYICVVCGLQLKTQHTLSTHMVVHSDERKFKCNLCSNEYKRSKALKTHLLTHSGVKRYFCDFCDKTFTTAENCRLHLNKHHPVEHEQQKAAGKNEISKIVVPELKKLHAELIRRKHEQNELYSQIAVDRIFQNNM